MSISPAFDRPAQTLSKIDASFFTESRVGLTRVCVQGVHVTGKGAKHDALVSFPVAPEGNPTMEPKGGTLLPPCLRIETLQLLSGPSIESDNDIQRRARVQDAVDDDR